MPRCLITCRVRCSGCSCSRVVPPQQLLRCLSTSGVGLWGTWAMSSRRSVGVIMHTQRLALMQPGCLLTGCWWWIMSWGMCGSWLCMHLLTMLLLPMPLMKLQRQGCLLLLLPQQQPGLLLEGKTIAIAVLLGCQRPQLQVSQPHPQPVKVLPGWTAALTAASHAAKGLGPAWRSCSCLLLPPSPLAAAACRAAVQEACCLL